MDLTRGRTSRQVLTSLQTTTTFGKSLIWERRIDHDSLWSGTVGRLIGSSARYSAKFLRAWKNVSSSARMSLKQRRTESSVRFSRLTGEAVSPSSRASAEL